MKKIREFQEVPEATTSPKNEKSEVLEMLKAGYKIISNKNDFLIRNKSKMQQFGITESELAYNIN